MSLLARARQKRRDLGYATDFVSSVMAPLAMSISEKRIRVVANAGGVNPLGCRDALRAALDEVGVDLSIAVVLGDDVTAKLDALKPLDPTEPPEFSPDAVASANAYLGAFPIAEALRHGADIVITGRTVDSALALGPLIAQFGWTEADLDRLAMGSLAGHIIECGTQATGGIFTDFAEVWDGWADMGFPIVECAADGGFVVTKPPQTGGLINAATVAEQIVYEVHDPCSYVLPDVVCDFTRVTLTDLGGDRVSVSGARGRARPKDYKVSVTYADGFRSSVLLLVVGPDAVLRAHRVGEAIVARTTRLLREAGFSDYAATSIEVLGSERLYGPHGRRADTRECVLKIAVQHSDERALELFSREVFPAATAMAQGLSGFAGGRPSIQPVVRLASCSIAREHVRVEMDINGRRLPFSESASPAEAVRREEIPPGYAVASLQGPWTEVPLMALAYGRSGDKGNTANIGVIARRPEFIPALSSALTAEAVRAYFAHLIEGTVERYEWPGIEGFNFVLKRALGGGGIASLRADPQGKAYAQMLMDFPVRVPRQWREKGGLLDLKSDTVQHHDPF